MTRSPYPHRQTHTYPHLPLAFLASFNHLLFKSQFNLLKLGHRLCLLHLNYFIQLIVFVM